MKIDWYFKTTLAQMQQQRYRTVDALQNGRGEWPGGILVEIVDKRQGAVTLKAVEPCPHCGVRLYISKVSVTELVVAP